MKFQHAWIAPFLFCILAPPTARFARAHQIASVSQIKEQIRLLEVSASDQSLPDNVQALNQNALRERRQQYYELLTSREQALQRYLSSNSVISAQEKKAVEASLCKLTTTLKNLHANVNVTTSKPDPSTPVLGDKPKPCSCNCPGGPIDCDEGQLGYCTCQGGTCKGGCLNTRRSRYTVAAFVVSRITGEDVTTRRLLQSPKRYAPILEELLESGNDGTYTITYRNQNPISFSITNEDAERLRQVLRDLNARSAKYVFGLQPSSLSFAEGETKFGLASRLSYNVDDFITYELEIIFSPQKDLELASRNNGRGWIGLAGIKFGRAYEKFGLFTKSDIGFVSFSSGKIEIAPSIQPLNLSTLNIIGKRSTHLAGSIGGGLEFYPSNRVITRLDIRDLIIHFKDQTVFNVSSSLPETITPRLIKGGKKQNLMINLGVGFRF